MGFRLFRRIKIIPGLRANLSMSGISLSAGKRGVGWLTANRHGMRATADTGIPGLWYTKYETNAHGGGKSGKPKGPRSKHYARAAEQEAPKTYRWLDPERPRDHQPTGWITGPENHMPVAVNVLMVLVTLPVLAFMLWVIYMFIYFAIYP